MRTTLREDTGGLRVKVDLSDQSVANSEILRLSRELMRDRGGKDEVERSLGWVEIHRVKDALSWLNSATVWLVRPLNYGTGLV